MSLKVNHKQSLNFPNYIKYYPLSYQIMTKISHVVKFVTFLFKYSVLSKFLLIPLRVMRPPSHEVSQKYFLAVEESLNSIYRQGRAAKSSIGPHELSRILKNKIFKELVDYAISKGRWISQHTKFQGV